MAVVGLRRAEDLHDAGEQSIGAGAHVDGAGGQPQGLDLYQGHADHRNHSRSHAAQSPAA